MSTVEALKKYSKRSIVINCNPETVSTDYDTSDRLYFEELTFERVADICEFELPYGVIVSVGGQTPNNRARALQRYGFRLLGTDANDIDRAEDRNNFSRLLDTLKRMSLLSSDRSTNAVRLELSENSLRVTSQNPDLGDARDRPHTP